MADINSAMGVLFNQGNVMAVPVIAGILIILIAVVILIFMRWKREDRNPYFFEELLRMHKNYKYVFYVEDIGNGAFSIKDFKLEPYGSKGIYFRKYNVALPIMEEQFIDGGKTDYLFAKVYSSRSVVPLKLVHINNIKPDDQDLMAVIDGTKEKQDLFLEHNFATLIRNEAEITKRGGGLFSLLRDNAFLFFLGIVIIIGFVCMFAYAQETSKYITQINSQQFAKVNEIYSSLYARMDYCDKILLKYGTEWEKAYYSSLPNPFAPSSVNMSKPR